MSLAEAGSSTPHQLWVPMHSTRTPNCGPGVRGTARPALSICTSPLLPRAPSPEPCCFLLKPPVNVIRRWKNCTSLTAPWAARAGSWLSLSAGERGHPPVPLAAGGADGDRDGSRGAAGRGCLRAAQGHSLPYLGPSLFAVVLMLTIIFLPAGARPGGEPPARFASLRPDRPRSKEGGRDRLSALPSHVNK